MEEETNYIVEITPEAEVYYLQFLEFLYKTHSKINAEKKADELLDMAMKLNKNPYRGRIEETLAFLKKEHRFLVYQYTSRKTVKIIYFIDESVKKIYLTDFFGTEMDDHKIASRNK